MTKRVILNRSEWLAVDPNGHIRAKGGYLEDVNIRFDERGIGPINQRDPLTVEKFAQQVKPIAGDVKPIKIVAILNPKQQTITIVFGAILLFGINFKLEMIFDRPMG